MAVMEQKALLQMVEAVIHRESVDVWCYNRPGLA